VVSELCGGVNYCLLPVRKRYRFQLAIDNEEAMMTALTVTGKGLHEHF
jgi:hypothetical protein